MASRAAQIALVLVALASMGYLAFGISQGYFPFDGVQPLPTGR